MAFSDLVATTDRAVRDHLGSVPVVYTPSAGGAVTVNGMFDENYVLVDPGETGVEQLGPAVWLELADLPVHPDDDDALELTIAGETYRVIERKPDSLSSIMLHLHLVDA